MRHQTLTSLTDDIIYIRVICRLSPRSLGHVTSISTATPSSPLHGAPATRTPRNTEKLPALPKQAHSTPTSVPFHPINKSPLPPPLSLHHHNPPRHQTKHHGPRPPLPRRHADRLRDPERSRQHAGAHNIHRRLSQRRLPSRQRPEDRWRQWLPPGGGGGIQLATLGGVWERRRGAEAEDVEREGPVGCAGGGVGGAGAGVAEAGYVSQFFPLEATFPFTP